MRNIYAVLNKQYFILKSIFLETNTKTALILVKFLSVCRAGPPFFASSLCHDLFIQTFSQFPYQKFMVLCMKYIYIYIYISWLGSYIQQMSNAMTANVKCIVTWQYVGRKRKNIFMASFYG